MKKTEVFIEGFEGKKLHVFTVTPEGKTKGIVHLVHGMGEHSARYEHFASYLAEQGYTVYGHDHRGHGKSLAEDQAVGVFDASDSFASMVEDIHLVQQYIDKEENSKNITLLGHSMGSLLVRAYLQREDVLAKRAVIMGTMKRFMPVFPSIMIGLTWLTSVFIPKTTRNHFVARLLNSSINKPFKKGQTKFDWLSTDPKVVEAYIEDELCGYSYNGRFYQSFFKMLITVNSKKNMEKTANIPLLFISGKQDPLSKGMRAILKLEKNYQSYLSDAKTTTKTIYNARHEVLNSPQKLYVYEYLVDWIKEN